MGSSLPVLFIAPIIGAYADRNGRRMPYIFSLLGATLSCGIWTAAAVFAERISIVSIAISAEVASGIFGGFATMYALGSAIFIDDTHADGAFANANDIPMRVAVACSVQQVAYLLGSFVTSTIQEATGTRSAAAKRNGFVALYALATGAMASALIYAYVRVRDNYKRTLEREQEAREAAGEPSPQRPNLLVATALSLLETCRVAVTPRDGNKRLCLNILIFLIFVEFLTFGKRARVRKTIRRLSNVFRHSNSAFIR